MTKRTSASVLLLAIFVCGASFGGRGSKGVHKMVIAPVNDLEAVFQVPEASHKNPINLLSMDPASGDTIGKTDYDYGWNSGTRQMVEAYFPGATPGTRAQFSFMQRDGLLTGNAARRAQSYVYYNGTTYSAVAATVDKNTRATGFGDITVYRSSSADGYAVVTSHVPPAAAINSAPGSGTFTFANITLPRPLGAGPGDPVSAVRGTSDTLYVVTSGADRTDNWVHRSVDFGVTWQFVDSLRRYTPKVVATSLDPTVQVRPNGVIYVFCALEGVGAVPPIGTVGDLDSADQIGYYRSTNNGVSWTWTRVAVDGQVYETSGGIVDRCLPENFSQLDGCVDNNGVVHIVFNGYGVSYGPTDTLDLVKIMYWNSSSPTIFKNISRAADTRDPAFDPAFRSGNALGRCYPTISYDPASRMLFAAWSEPRKTGAAYDTVNGFHMYDVWWAWSDNGGTTWTTPVNATNTPGRSELFTTADRYLTVAGTATSSNRAHLVYFSEAAANNGSFVFNQGPRSQSAWIYRTADRVRTGVDDPTGLPSKFALDQNYPNPFNPSTKIAYNLGTSSLVKLSVFNVLGQEVATLVNGAKEAGEHAVEFAATNLPSGVYFYTLNAGSFTETKKMVVMK